MIFTQYGDEAYTRGLNVYLTLNATEQTLAYHALRKGIMDYERRQVYRGPEDYVDLPADRKELDRRIDEALAGPPRQRRRCAPRSSPRRRRRRWSRCCRTARSPRSIGDGLKPAASALVPTRPIRRRRSGRGAVIRLIRGRPRTTWEITQLPEVEGAFVAIDPRTGSIRALVGGFDYSQEQVQPRDAGLAPARLELQALHLLGRARKGLHAGDGGQRRAAVLRRRHHRRPALGAEELRRHLRRPDDAAQRRSRSRRTWSRSASCRRSARPTRRTGSRASASTPTSTRAYLTMALGAGSVTPMQMASAYAVFANGGYRVNPLPDHPHHRPQGQRPRRGAGADCSTSRRARSTRATPSS